MAYLIIQQRDTNTSILADPQHKLKTRYELIAYRSATVQLSNLNWKGKANRLHVYNNKAMCFMQLHWKNWIHIFFDRP